MSLNVQRVEGVWYLYADFTQNCYTSECKRMQPAAWKPVAGTTTMRSSPE